MYNYYIYITYTCLEQCPLYRMMEMIFWSKHIVGRLCLHMRAAHRQTICCRFCLGTLVLKQAWSRDVRVGACTCISASSLPHWKAGRSSDTDWDLRSESALSEHIVAISPCSVAPTSFKRWPLMIWSFQQCCAIWYRLPLATNLPRYFRDGVRT